MLILYKYFIYNARDNGKTSYANFKIVIKNTSNIERKLSENEPKKKQRYLKKWKKVNEIFKILKLFKNVQCGRVGGTKHLLCCSLNCCVICTAVVLHIIYLSFF